MQLAPEIAIDQRNNTQSGDSQNRTVLAPFLAHMSPIITFEHPSHPLADTEVKPFPPEQNMVPDMNARHRDPRKGSWTAAPRTRIDDGRKSSAIGGRIEQPAHRIEWVVGYAPVSISHQSAVENAIG